jgi:chromosome partitioning protein
MRKIAFVNQKGGVGKTTTVVNLGAGLARLGQRVLIVDLDPQANATLGLGINPEQGLNNIYDVLGGKLCATEAIVEIAERLYLIPSTLELAGAELELSTTPGREFVLKDVLKKVNEFNFVLVDCPPSLGILNINALVYVNEIVIPLQCEFLALQGLSLLLKTIKLVRERLNPGLSLTGIVACMFDIRKGLCKEVVQEIEGFFLSFYPATRVFQTKIRTNVRLAEAPSHGKSIFKYAPESHGALDYMSLAYEVLGLSVAEGVPSVETASV